MDDIISGFQPPPLEGPPPQETPPSTDIGKLLQGAFVLGEVKTEALTGLAGTSDEITQTEQKTTSETKKEEESHEEGIDEPVLHAPDNAMINKIIRRLGSLAVKYLKATGEPLPKNVVPAGNAFLTGSMLVDLFKILTEIARLQAKIAYDTAQVKINMSHVMIETAKEISELIVELGEIAAQKCKLEAYRAITEAVLSFVQAAFTVGVMIATPLLAKKQEKELVKQKETALKEADLKEINNNPPGTTKYFECKPSGQAGQKTATDTQSKTNEDLQFKQPNGEADFKKDTALSSETKTQIQNTNMTRMQQFLTLESSLAGGSKGVVEAILKFEQADLERAGAYDEAAKTMLNQLLEMLNKTSSELGGDVDKIRSSIEALLQKLSEIMHVASTIGQVQG